MASPRSEPLDSVPAWVAQVYLGELDDSVAAQLADCGIQVGDRVELDLTKAASVLGDETCAALRAYQERIRSFLDAWADGQPTGPYMVVSRPLVRARQQDTKEGRVDLTAYLDACADVPLLADIAEELTGPSPDWERLARLGETGDVTIDRDGNETRLSVTVEAAEWPAELGGPATLGELARRVTLVANHAAWRDRRNRRLVEVAVDAEEVWPDPAAR